MASKKPRNSNCSVPNCCVSKKLRPELGFFSLPKNPVRAKQWLQRLSLSDTIDQVIVCEEHFDKLQITENHAGKRRLDGNAVPTLKLPQSKTTPFPQPIQIIKKERYIDHLIQDSEQTATDESEHEKKYDDLVEPYSKTEKRKIDENAVLPESPPQKRTNTNQVDDILVKSASAAIQTTGNEDEVDRDCIQLIEMRKKMKNMALSKKACYQLSMRLYLRFPSTYKILRNVLCGPPVSELKYVFKESSISLEKETLFPKFLIEKVFHTATPKIKQCFVSLLEIEVKPRVYYDIDNDHLLGIYDFNNKLKPEPATTAIVMILQGLFDEWKQPVSVCYVNKTTSIISWIDENIRILLEIGYNVRAVVTDMRSIYFQKDIIVINKFKKIYCINDLSYLFRSFYYNFIKYDYLFDGVLAEWRHIEEYYNLDSKKDMPLTPKVTDKHINPTNFQEFDIKCVREVFCPSTAAAMSTYIDFKLLGQSARSTVLLMTKMNKLYDILNTGRFDDNNIYNNAGFAGKASDLEFLEDMVSFFDDFKIVLNEREVKIPEGIMNIYKLKMVTKTILLLSEDLKRDNYETFPFWRLNLDAAEFFSDKVRKHSKSITKPSAKAVDSMFRQLAIINFLKPYSKIVSPIELNLVTSEYQSIFQNFKMIYDKYSGDRILNLAKNKKNQINLVINKADYEALDVGRKDAIVYIAGFLLKKCTDVHDCDDLEKYNGETLNDVETVSMCEGIMEDVKNNICVVPSTEFIEFVETMEILFRTFMNKDTLHMTNRKIVYSIVNSMELMNVPMPCTCFPELYVKLLYVRFRLHHTIKYNNDLFKTKRHKSFVVNNI